jgi:hypothetical protein
MAVSKPTAREDLALRQVDADAVVYDFRSHKAHCLNATALAVFKKCDGTRTAAAIAKELTRELGGDVDEEVVLMALGQLDAQKLLTAPLDLARVDVDRRRVLKKLALTAGLSIALPAVWSILAPTPAYAASTACFPSGDCMGANSPGGCCSNSGKAGTCTAAMTCGGTSAACHGQTCSS